MAQVPPRKLAYEVKSPKAETPKSWTNYSYPSESASRSITPMKIRDLSVEKITKRPVKVIKKSSEAPDPKIISLTKDQKPS